MMLVGFDIALVLSLTVRRHPLKTAKIYLSAQICLAYQIVPGEFSGSSFEYDLAGFQYITSMRDRQRHRRVLLDQQDGNPRRINLLDILKYEFDDLRRQAMNRASSSKSLGV